MKAIWMMVVDGNEEFSLMEHPVQCQALKKLEELRDKKAFQCSEAKTLDEWSALYRQRKPEKRSAPDD